MGKSKLQSVIDKLAQTSPIAAWVYVRLSAQAVNGEIDIGTRTWASDNGVTREQLRKALKVLSNCKLTTHLTTHHTTHISFYYNDNCNISRPTLQPTSKPTITNTTSSNALSIPEYVSPLFADAWQLWLEYRRDTKRPYANDKQARIGYNQFIKKANNDPATAMEMVNETIANGWQGLHPDAINNGKQASNSVVRATESRYSSIKRAAEAILQQPDNLDTYLDDTGRHT